MARFTSLIPGVEIPSPAEDFRDAKKIEQYRIGAQALYIPAGLRWNYLPLSAVQSAEESHRVVSAGHCVTVDLHRPTVDITTAQRVISVNLERESSMHALLELLGAKG